MIVLWGLLSDCPLRRVLDELRSMAETVEVFDQWRVLDMDVDLSVEGAVAGRVRVDGRTIELEEVTALYARPYDWSELSAQRRFQRDGPTWRHAAQVEEAIHAWWSVMPGIVVNSPSAMASNGSKPYQLSLIRAAGLCVPHTLVTTDPVAVREFWERYGTVVYKSTSGVRSRVARLTLEHEIRLRDVVWCPTQFQEYIPGTDVRVHVIGDELFATEIVTEATDYRYAQAEAAGAPDLSPCVLPDDVRDSCVAVAAGLGLVMAGVDLRRTPDGRWFCLEVNPSPGFTYYESATDQSMAAATARLLSGRQAHRRSPRPVPTDAQAREAGWIAAGRQPFIRRDERPEVGRAAIEEMLETSPSTDQGSGARV